MPCYRPLQAFYGSRRDNGKNRIVFDESLADSSLSLQLPCGQCIGCRLERSRQWAIRCVYESKLYDSNCFITLTYNDKHLPFDFSLNVKHFQDFMKRFRKRFGKGIRYFHCGEYGELNGRPHYHACIFNFDFSDRVLYTVRNGIKLYTSEILSDLWPFGFSSVGDVTFESAAYVARYIVKKITGKLADEHYRNIGCVNLQTGEVFAKKPEYTTMSRRPGIGADYFKQYVSDVYPSDSVVVRGFPMRPPKYFDYLYEFDEPDSMSLIKERRVDKASKFSADNTRERLLVRERCQQSKLDLLVRNLE